MPTQYELDFRAQTAIECRRSARRRTLSLEVHPDLRVILRAPLRCPQSLIEQFLSSRRDWVERQLAHFRSRPAPPPVMPDATQGQQRYLGQPLEVRAAPEAATGCQLVDRVLVLGGRHARDGHSRQRALLGWYRARAEELFEGLITTWHAHPEFSHHPRPVLKLRTMRTRWGSLSPRTGMTLNLLLIHAELEAIEYVVVHELCHLRHRGHGPAFHAQLQRVLPDWRVRKARLDGR